MNIDLALNDHLVADDTWGCLRGRGLRTASASVWDAEGEEGDCEEEGDEVK